MKIKIKRIDKELPLPTVDKDAVGFDFFCRQDISIPAGEIKLVPSNSVIVVPKGYGLFVFPRSSTPLKKGLALANSVGIVDPFYCGDKDEILLQFKNFTNQTVEIKRGDNLAQGVVIKHEEIQWEEVDSTGEVGEGGYWTTKK